MTYTNEFELFADRETKIEEYFEEMELTFLNEISDNIRDQKNIFFVDLSGEEVVREKTYFACLVKQNNDEIEDPIKKFEEVLKNGELSEDFSKIKEIYILVLTDSIKEEQLYTETLNKKRYKVKLEKILQNKIIHFTARSVIHKDSNLSCTVRITNRIQTAIPSVTSKLTSNTKGRIYTAKLCDLVELYTLTGNELFRSNLRIGLEDLLSVDTEIKTTLKHNPEEFWFLNNGITLILPKQSVDQSSFDSIKLNNLYSDDKVLNASVINGAQTITASSGYFLNLKKEYTADEIEEAKNKAEVILRVITYEENFDEHLATSSLINKVTVALNRQKPIKGQDIALVTPFVLSIGELKKEITNSNSINVFSFIRRGEAISNENHQYDLSNIVKIFKAVLEQNPSAIKSIKDDVLLKIDDTTKNFSNSAMFNQFLTLENYENNHGQFIKEFNKSYSFVNTAVEIQNLITKYNKYIVRDFSKIKSEELKNFLKSFGPEEEVMHKRIYGLTSQGSYHILSYYLYSQCYKQLAKTNNHEIILQKLVSDIDFSTIDFSKDFLKDISSIEKYLKWIQEEFINYWQQFKKEVTPEIDIDSYFTRSAFQSISRDNEFITKYIKSLMQ